MDIEKVRDIPSLDLYLAEREATGLWKRMGGARVEFKPHLWKWADLHEGLKKVCQAVQSDPTGELGRKLQGHKRLRLVNPSLRDKATRSMGLSMQALLPGERTACQRHSEARLRFILKGGVGAVSLVEGEAMPMQEGDVITIPSWAWHECYNEGDEPVFWLDLSDGPIAELAEIFHETKDSEKPAARPQGYAARISGTAKPSWIKPELSAIPSRYPREETYTTLQALKEGKLEPDPHDGLRLIYTNPQTGRSTFPTLCAEVHLLRPQDKTQIHRHNSTSVYHVVAGHGVTVVANERWEWARGDTFVIPPWFFHSHENPHSEDATLLCVTDRPTLEALGFYREEATP